MVEIGEQLGWLTTALRSSTDGGRIAVYCPTVEISQSGADPTLPFSFNISASLVGYEDAPVGPGARNGKCWQKLFRNPVVVWGYPIPRRQEVITGTGLEIPLDMLVALTDASGLSEFDGRLFIKGYSAMLIPTRQVDDLILWHLLYNEDGARISYTDCRLAALDHIQTTAVKQARHILGWVTHARNNTGSPDANYHIKWSGLGKPRERHAWEKVIISGGDPVGVSASFVIGKKDKGIFSGALGGYTSRLKFIAKQYVVLYDLGDRRAWLVDGLSALLHLVRASLEHDQRDVFNSFFLYKQGQIKECLASMHGLDAAAAVLFNPENYSLKLYTESEDTWDEETERQHNGAQGTETVKEVISKRKVTYYCLRDKVLEVFSLLEKMIDHLNNVQSEGGVGFRLRGTPRNILEGFDFMDVATSNAPLRPHMIKLNICESGRGWTDLLRSIQAITLFGKGFGELISPSTSNVIDPPCDGCGYGISLPIGRDYLATCVSLVERILTTRGSTESVPWCLADDIYWHTPGALFDPCQCAHASKGSKPRDRVQVLLPSTYPKLWGRGFASPTNLESQGAVIFSHNWRVPFRLGHQASQDQKMLEPPDSGLGTSIDSSSGRSQLSGSFDDSETQASNPADESSIRSVGSPIEAETVLDVISPGQEPEIVTSSRKRKLVDMVDRVKRKVLKTSPNIGLDRLPDDGASQASSILAEGTGASGGSGLLTEKDKATIL
ncbi:hypothetical protein BR93DRAFT_927743 [Coniochaeta sp. PMI_546]|nr:hypothetical protein BR93DRAFT_927743 [Coniochaeta sp. PMI_546]